MPSDEGHHAWTRLSRETADALAAIVQSSDDAIYSKDADAIITSWNPAAERLYGYSSEEAIGSPISMLIPPDRAGEELDILERILAGERVEHYETKRLRKDGSIVEVSVSVSPVHDESGKVIEAAAIARDVSERKMLEANLAAERAARAELGRKHALDLNDAVVQGLAAAKLALESDQLEEGLRSVTATLERAKGIVSDLLVGEGGHVSPGDLVRSDAAVVSEE